MQSAPADHAQQQVNAEKSDEQGGGSADQVWHNGAGWYGIEILERQESRSEYRGQGKQERKAGGSFTVDATQQKCGDG